MLVLVARTILGWSGKGKISFFCGDETRLGLKTLVQLGKSYPLA